MIDEVPLRPRRDDQEGQARSVSAAPLLSVSRRGAAAQIRTGQSIGSGLRLMHDWAHLMIVPSVGVVVRDEYRGALPLWTLHDEVDRIDEELLLIERIGVLSVAVLEARRLQKSDLRHVAGAGRIKEVVDVVLMVGAVAEAYVADAGRPSVIRIAGVREILEWLMMRNVIELGDAGDGRERRALASGGSVGVGNPQIEAALKPAPGVTGGVQQVADIFAGVCEKEAVTRGAKVLGRLAIADRTVTGNITCGSGHVVWIAVGSGD